MQSHCEVTIHQLFLGVVSVSSLVCNVASAADRDKMTFEQLFAPEHLVDVEVTIEEEDWDVLRHQTRNIAQALRKTPPERPYTYFRADVTVDGVEIPAAGVRKKGFVGSLDSVRPSLKIKFNEYQKNGKLGGVDRLTLNNNKQDQSLVSQYLTYKLFRDAGVAAPQCNFARVTVNGEFLGIYSNVEPIKKDFLKRRFGDGSGNLFEGCLSDFMGDAVYRFQIKNNDDTSDLTDLIEVADILASEDEDWRQRLDEVVDVDAFMRFWALEALTGFWDGYSSNQNNYFLYQNPSDGRFQFIPWGADSALTKRGFAFFMQLGPKSVRARAVLPHRLYRDPTSQQQYLETLHELLDTVWNEEQLLAECDRVEAMLKDHLHKSQGRLSRGLYGTRKFIENRRREVMAEIEDGPAEWEWPARKPSYFEGIGKLTATFSASRQESAPRRPLEAGKIDVTLLTVGDDELKPKHAGVSVHRAGEQDMLVVSLETEKGRKMTASVPLDLDGVEPDAGQPLQLMGSFVERAGLFGFFGGGKSLGNATAAGTVRLEEAGREPGETVRGELSLEVLKIRHLFGD